MRQLGFRKTFLYFLAFLLFVTNGFAIWVKRGENDGHEKVWVLSFELEFVILWKFLKQQSCKII